jgi:hypothetical protein
LMDDLNHSARYLYLMCTYIRSDIQIVLDLPSPTSAHPSMSSVTATFVWCCSKPLTAWRQSSKIDSTSDDSGRPFLGFLSIIRISRSARAEARLPESQNISRLASRVHCCIIDSIIASPEAMFFEASASCARLCT